MNRRRFLLSLTGLSTLAGCTSTNSTPDDTTATALTTQEPTTSTTATTTAPPKPDIELVDASIPETAPYGEAVTITLTFQNSGEKGSYVDTNLLLDKIFRQTRVPVKVKVSAGTERTTQLVVNPKTSGTASMTLEADQHLRTTRFQTRIESITRPIPGSYTYGDDLQLTILDREQATELPLYRPNDPLKPKSGGQFVLYRLEFKTTSPESALVNHILTGNGAEYPATFLRDYADVSPTNIQGKRIFVEKPMIMGESQFTGWALFEIPPDADPNTLSYTRKIAGGTPVLWTS